MKRVFATFGDTTLLYGNVVEDENGIESIPVYFERPNAKSGDYDFAEGLVPNCTFQKSAGFSEFELSSLSRRLRDNMMLIFDDARELQVA